MLRVLTNETWRDKIRNGTQVVLKNAVTMVDLPLEKDIGYIGYSRIKKGLWTEWSDPRAMWTFHKDWKTTQYQLLVAKPVQPSKRRMQQTYTNFHIIQQLQIESLTQKICFQIQNWTAWNFSIQDLHVKQPKCNGRAPNKPQFLITPHVFKDLGVESLMKISQYNLTHNLTHILIFSWQNILAVVLVQRPCTYVDTTSLTMCICDASMNTSVRPGCPA